MDRLTQNAWNKTLKEKLDKHYITKVMTLKDFRIVYSHDMVKISDKDKNVIDNIIDENEFIHVTIEIINNFDRFVVTNIELVTDKYIKEKFS